MIYVIMNFVHDYRYNYFLSVSNRAVFLNRFENSEKSIKPSPFESAATTISLISSSETDSPSSLIVSLISSAVISPSPF